MFKKQNEGLKSHEKFALQLLGAAILWHCIFKWKPTSYLPSLFGEVNSIVLRYSQLFGLQVFKCSEFNRWFRWISHFNKYYCICNLRNYRNTCRSKFNCCILFLCSRGISRLLIIQLKPAKVFMGDVGSLALGAGLVIISIMLHKEWTLLLVGIIFVLKLLALSRK